MIGQLNVDSMRNKFEMLTPLIANKIDVLLLSETEIETLPLEQFSGFEKPVRLDRNLKGGSIMLFIRAYSFQTVKTWKPSIQHRSRFY